MMDDRKMTVYKETVPVDDQVHAIELPVEAEIVCVDHQTRVNEVVFWYTCWVPGPGWLPHDAAKRTAHFLVVGTGHSVPANALYRGTVNLYQVGLVWHLFELPTGVA